MRYLFQRPDSKFWQLKLQSPDGRREISLRTTDHAEAEILAAPLITEHKRKLLAKRPRFATVWQHELEPGHTHPGPDGGSIVATDTQLIYLNHNGDVIKTTANGRTAYQLTGGPLTVQSLTAAAQAALDPRPAVATKGEDDALFESYLKERSVTGFKEGEARHMWELFRALCPGVKLKDATRDDGRKLVAHLETLGNKSATVRKKMMWLAACVNFGIDEGRLKFNPFIHIVSKKKDATKICPFTDDDMAVIRANLDKLSAADRLLIRVLGTTGMRLSEAYQITSEKKERGVRYTIIGRKTEQSERRVPFPAKLLPHLPDKIEGVLFADNEHLASGRLRKFLRKVCGITDKGKVAAHSFRHRAQDRLRAAGLRKDQREELLGHTRKTVGEGYGEGSPVPMLKRWIDKIGM
jgi:integrase